MQKVDIPSGCRSRFVGARARLEHADGRGRHRRVRVDARRTGNKRETSPVSRTHTPLGTKAGLCFDKLVLPVVSE